MRRWLSLLLLIMLPLQANWAALASYCQHEQDLQTQHIGHHSHQHRAITPDDDGSSATLSPQPSHSDCSTCLAATLTPLAHDDPHLGWVSLAHPPPDSSAARPLFRPSTPPERPDWSHLA